MAEALSGQAGVPLSADETTKQLVLKRLISTFETDPESLSRILYYLGDEEKLYDQMGSQGVVPPVWRTLSLLAKSGTREAFLQYAERLADDTKRAENDVKFRYTMGQMYSHFLLPSDTINEPSSTPDLSQLVSLKEKPVVISSLIGFSRAWDIIPVRTQERILQFSKALVAKSPRFSAVDDVVDLLSKHGGSMVLAALAIGQLSYDAFNNIYKWLKEEITGMRCCANVVSSIIQVSSGVSGGMAGAAIGSALGPVGTVVGGVLGGFGAAKAAKMLGDFLTAKVFKLPKEVAVENAYLYFGLGMSPSANEVNAAYRKMCLKHHPDKGGRQEDFELVQVQLAIIRVHWENPSITDSVNENNGITGQTNSTANVPTLGITAARVESQAPN